MIKRILTSIALLTLPVCSWAGINGFYAGFGLGIDSVTFSQNSHIQQLRIDPHAPDGGNFNVIDNTDLSAQDVLGNIFLGYSRHYGKWYLAVEGNAGLSSAQYHRQNHEFIHGTFSDVRYKIEQIYGVGIVPGVLLPEATLLFGRVGFAGGKFNSKSTDISIANQSKTVTGVRYGVGLEKHLTGHSSLRFEFSQIRYSKIGNNTFDPSSGVTKNTKIQPTANQFEIGYVYRFA